VQKYAAAKKARASMCPGRQEEEQKKVNARSVEQALEEQEAPELLPDGHRELESSE
jgi:hypothetical protein